MDLHRLRASRPHVGGARVVVTVTLALLASGCDGDTTEVLCASTTFGASDEAHQVESFVETWGTLVEAAHEIDRDMRNACRALAADLGIPSASLLPAPTSDPAAPGAETQVACDRVKQEIDRIVETDLPGDARLAVVSTAVECAVDVDARLGCEQQCDPNLVSVGHTSCAPTMTYGTCMTACTGSCTGTCASGCAGSCAGTCTGACTGSCDGACDGACAARNADGTCFGACTGTCTGVCDGQCSGTCGGVCDGSCSTSCAGVCAGTCAAWLLSPLCAEAQSLTASPPCGINCDARSRFGALCAEPVLAITYGTTATKLARADLDRLVSALRASYPTLAKVGFRASTMVGGAAAELAVALQGQSETARQVGRTASACVSQAIAGASDAVMQVNVSAHAAASIAASLTAPGGLLPP
jgi:hypothetical protein